MSTCQIQTRIYASQGTGWPSACPYVMCSNGLQRTYTPDTQPCQACTIASVTSQNLAKPLVPVQQAKVVATGGAGLEAKQLAQATIFCPRKHVTVKVLVTGVFNNPQKWYMPACTGPQRLSYHVQPRRLGAQAKICCLHGCSLPCEQHFLSAGRVSRQLPCSAGVQLLATKHIMMRVALTAKFQQINLICGYGSSVLTFHNSMKSSMGRFAASPTVSCLVRLSDILMVRMLLRSARHVGRNSGIIAGLCAGQAVLAYKQCHAASANHDHDQNSC